MDQMLFSFDFSLFNWVARWNWRRLRACAARPSPSAAPSCSTWRTPASRSGRPRRPSCGSSCSTRTSTAPACLACAFVFGAESLSPALAEELWQRPMRASSIPTVRPKPPARPPGSRSTRCARPRAESPSAAPSLCRRLHRPGRDLHRRRPCHARLPEPAGPERLAHVHARRAATAAATWARSARGLITFRGRIDDQIKLHGYRIELAEIDAAIAALPGVRAGARWRCAGRTAPSSG